MVEVVDPSAVTEAGLALTVEAEALTVPAMKFTVAVSVTHSTTASLAVNVTCPLALVVPLTVVIVELPLPAVRETVLPFTTFPPASLRVTVTVDVVDPSAVTDVGLAVTVEVPALTG